MEENKTISTEEAGNQTEVETKVEENSSNNNKTYSQEDVNRVVQKRITEVTSKLEKEKQAEIAKAVELAQMDAESREKKLAEMHEHELEEKDKALSLRENKLKALDILNQENLNISTGLVDCLINVDEEKTIENTNNFVKMFNEQVSQVVADKLKGEAPKDITSDKNELSNSSTAYRVL